MGFLDEIKNKMHLGGQQGYDQGYGQDDDYGYDDGYDLSLIHISEPTRP